ncbi:MAG: hypothetical protein HY804_02025 [Nitrospinae bacterium]|nr:hypothetical protein [Nitrospinota bacterium]
MAKKVAISSIAVFIVWSLMDYVIHGIILNPTYLQTASLWRPMEEMIMWPIYLATAVTAVAFCAIYGWLVNPKSLTAGLALGTLFGAASGVSMGAGTWAMMPIPEFMAMVWTLGLLIEFITAGLVVGALIKD